jgi:murein DD-endopeptidase MepM/ murein hydrolase activator NlpD
MLRRSLFALAAALILAALMPTVGGPDPVSAVGASRPLRRDAVPTAAATFDGQVTADIFRVAARQAMACSSIVAALPQELGPAPADPIEIVTVQSREMESMLRVRQACDPTVGPSPGRLSSPLPGARVTTKYGWRTHPVFHQREFHNGLDLAGRSTIVSPADGVVVEVDMRPAYGLTTIIDHGDGIATVIAHQASVAVRAGDHVRRGHAIGVVGRSGYATGNHLHVEVRLHGVPTDPRLWF